MAEKGKRARRDFEGMERRRMRAAGMYEKGKTQSEVARALGVSRQSASRWYHVWREEGREGLKAAGRAGRTPRITPSELAEVEERLLAGPGAHGYRSELWTLPRIAAVIEEVTGVRYHPGHVWRIVRSLGWSCQKPAKRAAERDEAAIAQWVKETWPRVKKTPAAGGLPSSL